MSRTYKVGQVWERDGRQREIVHISSGPIDRALVMWRRSGKAALRRCGCLGWIEWGRKATLVRDVDELLTGRAAK